MATRSHSRWQKRLRILLRHGQYRVLRLLLLSVLIGVVAGLGAIAFYWMLDAGTYLFMDLLAGYRPHGPGGEPELFEASGTPFRRWVLLVLPGIGGVLSGFLVFRFAPEAEGHGTDAAIDAYHFRQGKVRGRVPFIKALASTLTIGTGGSGGREGPIAQIGSGFGSVLASALKLSARERRVLMAAGMGGGVGAIFHAPLAGALFAAEVLYRDLDLEYEIIIPAMVSSIVAYAVFALQFGWDPLFITPDFVFDRPIHLLPYLVLALAVAGGAVLYVRCFYGVRDLFHRLKVPLYWKPAIGGIVVGIIGFFLPEAIGAGYGTVQKALVNGTPLAVGIGSIGIKALLIIFAAKIVTTSFSIGSGGSGGVFGPAVVIGGALGGAVGLAFDQALPGLGVSPGAFALVGMAGFFAASANTPISTIIMVSEMTGNYHLLAPSMWVSTLSYLLVRKEALYEKQLPSRFDSPVHRGDMLESVLRHLRVDDVITMRGAQKTLTISASATVAEMARHLAEARQSSFPVVDDTGRLAGIVRGRDVMAALASERDIGGLVIAGDLVRAVVTVTPQDNLLTTLRSMRTNDVEELVVIDPAGDGGLLTTIGHQDIIAAYHNQVYRDKG